MGSVNVSGANSAKKRAAASEPEIVAAPKEIVDPMVDYGTHINKIDRLSYKGKPVIRHKSEKWQCLLCRTQFDSKEKIGCHLEMSELHLVNLKAAKESSKLVLAEG